MESEFQGNEKSSSETQKMRGMAPSLCKSCAYRHDCGFAMKKYMSQVCEEYDPDRTLDWRKL